MHDGQFREPAQGLFFPAATASFPAAGCRNPVDVPPREGHRSHTAGVSRPRGKMDSVTDRGLS